MKRLLYAALQLPWPLDNGQKIVTFNDLTYLSRQFTIDLVSYIDPTQLAYKDAYLEQLRQRLPQVRFHEPIVHNLLRGHIVKDKALNLIRALARREPYVVSKYRSQAYRQTILQLLTQADYDVFYYESLAPSYLLSDLTAKMRQRTLVVYRAFDIFAETLASYAEEQGLSLTGLAARLDLAICKPYEQQLWQDADAIFSVTRRMNSLIARESPKLAEKLFYFPVFVDQTRPPRSFRATSYRVLYVGTVHYPPNLTGLKWFIDECWPQVIARNPAARLDIVGRGGDKLLPVPASVHIHNYVDDVEPFYAEADVFVVPLFAGSGIRLKILDALSRSIPIVSTTSGYIGLEVQEGGDILVADNAELFAAHITLLLRSSVRRERVAHNGRQFIEHYHSPALADQVLSQLAARLER